ncbi:MAG: RNA chaperone Hfq [Alphaproteobacteria bacterium]|nr:RNA chaperone Hfq [Alphaproteobacteria bacterium]MBQ3944688.1 RNA chaperone Hfq [Alphaproteobacteria bacterium]
MSERIMNIQDAFLNYMRRNRRPVTIYLIGGVKLTGLIACFDQNSIILKREGYTQLIYKHAISNFAPHGSISLFDWGETEKDTHKTSDADDVEDEEYEDDDGDYGYDYEDEDNE